MKAETNVEFYAGFSKLNFSFGDKSLLLAFFYSVAQAFLFFIYLDSFLAVFVFQVLKRKALKYTSSPGFYFIGPGSKARSIIFCGFFF